MPHKPYWHRRIPEALHCLGVISDPWIDRKAVEGLLGVSQTESQRILRKAGAVRAGGALMIVREQFYKWLKKVYDSAAVQEEVARVNRVEEQLAAGKQELKGRRVRIPHAADVEYRTLEGLSKAIELGPGELRIKFFGFEDLAANLLEVAKVMINDMDRVRAIVEDIGGPRLGV